MDSDGEGPGVLELDDVLGILNDAQASQTGAATGSSASVRKGLVGLRPGWKLGLRPGKKVKKKLDKKQAMLDKQARSYNASGRSRNPDYHMPLHEHGLQRQKSSGRGAWKTWSVPAILRAGFSAEKSAQRHIASSIEGAGQSHAASSRLVLAQAILTGQMKGLKNLSTQVSDQAPVSDQASGDTQPLKLMYAIKNIMFDESTFDLSFRDGIRASYSVLCSHAQLTYRVEGSHVVRDEHICRSPAVLSPVMNSATMHAALSAGPGGFTQTLSELVRFRATLSTSDAHAANVRLLKYVDQSLDRDHLFIPSLCLQHRVGNIVEQLTKFLGNLGGNFSISKVLNKGNLLKALRQKASAIMKNPEKLLVLGETPAPVLEEWSQAQLCAHDLVQLCMSFDDSEHARSGTHLEAFQRFENFFAGPWTGPCGATSG
ncbi:unnamed protein product [Symbiodinium natans]|uniref:Uncharacterized protein n=1 Tax=Symbiodinium natans TaxID=878477 RepID=A0A812M753_9DINO|nr:unnamed protein product [Symbiodinium natans]